MRAFLKRLFCLHLNWRKANSDDKGFIVGGVNWYGKQLNQYFCLHCGKEKMFSGDMPPINYNDYT